MERGVWVFGNLRRGFCFRQPSPLASLSAKPTAFKREGASSRRTRRQRRSPPLLRE